MLHTDFILFFLTPKLNRNVTDQGQRKQNQEDLCREFTR